jgi:hypothetical protein
MEDRVNVDSRHGVRAFGAVWRFARGHLPTLCIIVCVLGSRQKVEQTEWTR